MMMASSVVPGTVPVSQFDGSLHKPPDEGPDVVAIQTTAGVPVPVMLTITFWVVGAPSESVSVTV